MQMMKANPYFLAPFSSLVCCWYLWSRLLHSYPAGASCGLCSLLEWELGSENGGGKF